MHLKAIRLYDVERIIPTLGAPFAGFGRSALWQSLATSGFDLALELSNNNNAAENAIRPVALGRVTERPESKRKYARLFGTWLFNFDLRSLQ
jgi:hypothetical protein